MYPKFPEKSNYKKKHKTKKSNQTNDKMKEALAVLPKKGNGWWIREYVKRALLKR
jgi:hypothetical protein